MPPAAVSRTVLGTVPGVGLLGVALLAVGAKILTAGAGSDAGPLSGGWYLLGSGSVWAFLVASLWRRRALNVPLANPAAAPRSTLTVATWITVARGLLISSVAGFLLLPYPSSGAVWIPGFLYTAAALGDLLDGAVARRTHTATALGAALDVTTDATGLLVAPLLAVRWGQLPPWYLLLALAYPLFQGGLALRGHLGRPVHRERLRPNPWARRFAGIQMAVVAAALYPVLPRWFLWPVATLAMLPTLVRFAAEWRVATARV